MVLLHVAGPGELAYRMIDVWAPEDAWRRYQEERLSPACVELGIADRPRTMAGIDVLLPSEAALAELSLPDVPAG